LFVPSENTEQRKLAAIMFTDMVGYSALSQCNEALALELLAENQRLLRTQFPLFNGREVKSTGDGFLVEFPSALQATQCAVEIQRAIAARNGTQPIERHIHVRIGIHVGDVVHREADMYGDGVNIAARIEPLAVGGGICLSDTVYAQVRNKLDVGLTKLDSPELKYIEGPMDVYRVVLPWQQGTSTPVRPATMSRSKPGGRTVTVGLILVLVLGAVSWWLFQQRTSKRIAESKSNASTELAASASTGQKSIAVLPFVNMSADKADEYLSDGMTEELLNALTKVKQLRVPGRSSSFSFKGKTEEDIFRKVGRELHVNTVLEGSVRKAGDKLRVTAQLINVANGFHLWSETYDGDMKDILAFQSDVSKRVVEALRLQLGVEEARALAKRPTENAEAHRLYLLGRYNFAKFTQEGWTNGVRAFEQALQLDPRFALAYCGLADIYGWAGGQIMSGKEAWAKQMQLAQKALALDPDLAEAHLSMGTALQTSLDFKGSEKELDRAVALNPNLALAYDEYGWTFACLGRFDEALANEKKALALDPLNTLLNTDLAWFYYLARRYNEATAQIRITLQLDPNNAFAHLVLGWCLIGQKKVAEAGLEFQKATTLDDLPWYKASLGYTSAVLGDRAKAAQILRELEDLLKQRYVSPANVAAVYLGLGEKEKAFDWLEKAFADQDPVFWWITSDQLYDGIRNEPRFQELMKKLGPG
jgi:adenylate cyclase